jgi:ABC-2 type transport system permease protein
MTTQTYPNVSQESRLAARQGLLPARGSDWLAGFSNMLSKELGEWFHTRRWLWNLLIWPVIINGFVGLILFILPLLDAMLPGLNASMVKAYEQLPPGAKGLDFYFTMAMMAGSIGIVILAQDEIIMEKQTGTAAWILSKPAARQGFILTKLLSNSIGMLIFIVVLPAMVFLGEIYLDIHQVVPLVPFLVGEGVLMMGLFFYLSLVIMLGVVSESRMLVMGIPFGIIIGGMFLSRFIPPINYVLPTTIDKIAYVLVLGIPMPTMFISQLITSAVLSTVFILVALWRFQRKEL